MNYLSRVVIAANLLLFTTFSFSQIIGGRENSQSTPKTATPTTLSGGLFSGDVNTMTGVFATSIPLGSVATPSGPSYSLSLNYSSSFSMSTEQPMTSGIPYGDGRGQIFRLFLFNRMYLENSLVRSIRKSIGTQQVIVLTTLYSVSIIKQSILYGCNGYLLKDISSEELLCAISTVRSGESYYSNTVSQVLLKGRVVRPRRIGIDGVLTFRELQVLKLLAQEFSHIEIAEKLEISRRTVEGHNKSLRAKLKVKGVIGLVKYAIENGLI